MPFVYTIKWNDGFTHDAFEDELTPMPAEVPGLASVHINGLVHGIVREGGGISNRGPTTLYETFCGEVRATEWLDMATMKRGNQKEWPTCIGCIVLP